MSDKNKREDEQIEATLQPIAQPAVADLGATVDHQESAQSGKIIAGKYKLLNSIGEGGMGTVWMAEQRAPVKRMVAVKLVKAGMDSKMVLARFEAERQALALMDHPNIARILDGGITESGSPYFVMELVKGVPITEYCDAKKLTPQQRLELFVPVCQAIQHAHQKGIIHRDIKPSNVMVSVYDDRPVPKVIDFGVAKATGQALTEQTLNTGFSVVGTPQYMSPEQATFNQIDIDTRSDIYSLGVLLYELLAGSPPFQKKELEKAGYLEILRIIREEEPPRPSTKVSTAEGLPSLSATRSTEPKKLTGILRKELDWIVMKALEKDRSRRYETANAFASDIGRYLSGEAVQAHPPSQAYRLQKFFRKNKGPVLAASLVMLALLAGFIGTAYGLFEADKQRLVAVRKQEEAEREREKATASALAESEQRIKAEKAEDEALEAYRASTDEAIEKLMGSKEFFGPQEKKYLKNTLERWKKFSERQDDSERGQAIRAEAHFRVGKLWSKFGNLEQAGLEYEFAIDIQRKLSERQPDSANIQFDLAKSISEKGYLQSDLGSVDGAKKTYSEAVLISERLVKQFASEPKYQVFLARCHTDLAFSLQELGELDASRKEFEIAIANLSKLTEHYEDNPEIELNFNLACSRSNYAQTLERLGSAEEAISQRESAIAIFTKLVQDFQEVPSYRRNLAVTQGALGNYYLSSKHLKPDSALELLQQSIANFAALANDYPTVPEYKHCRNGSENDLANVLFSLGKFNEAIKQRESAIASQTELVNQYPKAAAYRRYLGIMTVTKVRELINLKRYDEAIELAKINFANLNTLIEQAHDVLEDQAMLAQNHIVMAQALGKLARHADGLIEARKAKAIMDNVMTTRNDSVRLKSVQVLSQLVLKSMLKASNKLEDTK